MSRCKIECYAVSYNPSGHISANGGMQTKARCVTHGWQFDGGGMLNVHSLCPIGQVEEAGEKAIAELRAELAKLRQ